MRFSAFSCAAAFVVATTAPFAHAAEMTEPERDAFRAEVRAYLLENPEVLVEAMSVLQAREESAAIAQDAQLLQTYHDALFNDPNSYVGGNPDGDITIVEFTDYRCTYCRKAFSEIEELMKADGNIRFVVKEYPILGEASVISARFAVAVLQLFGNDAYKAAHDGLITLRGDPDAATLTRLANDIGLDAEAVLARMMSPEVTSVIAANQDLGNRMRVSGTPTFVVKGQILRGYLPMEQMMQVVEAERAS
jgi:protein-disulfide isomerase